MWAWLRKKRYVVTSIGDNYKIIDSTYDQIADLKTAGTLKPGWKYRFTYNTKYNQLITDTLMTEADEILIITATSFDTFDLIACSEDFPDDYIEYDFDDNLCEDAVTERPGFIYTRRVGTFNVSGPYDIRTVKYARFPIDTASINDFAAVTIYAVGDLVKNSSKVYKCRLAYTSGATFADDLVLGYWAEILNYTETVYLAVRYIAGFWSYNGVNIPVLNTPQNFTTFDFAGSTLSNITLEDQGNNGNPRFNLNAVFHPSGQYFNIFVSAASLRLNFVNTVSSFRVEGFLNNCIVRGSGFCSIIGSATNVYFNGDSSVILGQLSVGTLAGTIFISKKASQLIVLHSDSSAPTVIIDFCQNIFVTNLENGIFKTVANTVFAPVTRQISEDVNISLTENKRFSGNYHYITYESSNTATKTYTTDYSNIVANKSSPQAFIDGDGVWYDIVDDGGTVTTDYFK